MPATPSLPSRSAVVSRLRAAGCVFAEDEAQLIISTATTPADLDAMVDRRSAGQPLEHVVGWARFCGLRIAVQPGVFVPRPRTEFLVHQAAALARRAATARRGPACVRPPTVVDLCCGTGAVGAALAAYLGRVELHAVDVDPAAVRCARRNISAAGGRAYVGDLYEPLPAALRGHVDLLCANVPYVPTEAVRLLPAEARMHEPRTALDGGADGLDMLRRVVAEAPRWLASGGHLLAEVSERQASRAAEILTGAGLDAQTASSDDLNATVILATS